jgi:hypothetical protein
MSFLFRWNRYLWTHGPITTTQRAVLGLKRLRCLGKHVVFSCELPLPEPRGVNPLSIEAISSPDHADIQRVLTHWDERTATRMTSERFKLGAQLWLARRNSELVAYGWTIRGKPVSSHFFQFSPTDIHLFDFVVFPEYRGARINPNFVLAILSRLGQSGGRRAFIECLAWNVPQLRSLSRTPFKQIGAGRKFEFCGHTAILWSPAHERLPEARHANKSNQ